jgi:ABC-2 type transport system ATP-binding protein
MLDLIRPTSGRVTVLGFDSRRESLAVRERVGYLPGELRLYESMRGDEFLDFIDCLRPSRRDARFRRMLVERLGVDPDRRIRALSKGNKQKLGLIQAMMHRPELLVLDEPTSGLDPLVQEEVGRLLEETAADGRTVLFSSHALPEVERICRTVGIIRAGRIVAIEEIAALKARSTHIIEVTFAEAPPPALFEIPGVRVLHRDGPTVRVQAQNAIDAVLKAVATQHVVDLRTEQPSLEDAFLGYYGAREDAEAHAGSPAPVGGR